MFLPGEHRRDSCYIPPVPQSNTKERLRARAVRLGPAFWISLGLHGALALALTRIPLFDVLGYESGAALSLLASFWAGLVALGAVRRAPLSRPGMATPAKLALFWAGRALLRNAVVLSLPLALLLLNALWVKNCAPGTGLAFFVLLPLASAAFASLLGVALGMVVRRRFLGGLAWGLLWLSLAAGYLLEAYLGLEVDSYNQLAGWIAGPIYDEVVEPSLPLVACRLHGLLWAGAALALSCAFLDRAKLRPRLAAVRANRAPLLAALALAAAGALVFAHGDALGFRRTRAAVERALPVVRATPHFLLHLPDGVSRERAAQLEQDFEFRYHQLERLFGPVALPPIHGYLFESAAKKRRLLGAGRTQFAKPWRNMLALNGTEFPHGTLMHELAHVYAGAFGAWPLYASSRFWFWFNPGLTEGLAVAAEYAGDPSYLHRWSAAMRRAGLAPKIERLFDPVGFWSEPARRSYLVAGSFVRFLIDRYGQEVFRRAYAAGTLEAYPATPAQLVAEWERRLDELEVEPAQVASAQVRFGQGSIFARPCAHEVARLQAQARASLGQGRSGEALRIARRILEWFPDDTDAWLLYLDALIRGEDDSEAYQTAQRLLARPELPPAARLGLLERLGGLEIRRQEAERACPYFEALLESNADEGANRLNLARLDAIARGEAGRRVLEFLQGEGGLAAGILALLEADRLEPDWGLPAYLLGRHLAQGASCRRALFWLERAGERGLPHPAFAAENLRLLLLCRYQTGDRQGAAEAAAVLAQYPPDSATRAQARDWLERLAFEAGLTCGE